MSEAPAETPNRCPHRDCTQRKEIPVSGQRRQHQEPCIFLCLLVLCMHILVWACVHVSTYMWSQEFPPQVLLLKTHHPPCFQRHGIFFARQVRLTGQQSTHFCFLGSNKHALSYSVFYMTSDDKTQVLMLALQAIHWLCCPPAQREFTKLFFTCTYFILVFGMCVFGFGVIRTCVQVREQLSRVLYFHTQIPAIRLISSNLVASTFTH